MPIATCSPDSTELLKSLGAVETFDYHTQDWGRRIREYTANNLTLALDCITSTDTMLMCYDAIGTGGGKYVGLEAVSAIVKYKRRDIDAKSLVALTMFGGPVKLAGVYSRPATPLHRQLARNFFILAENLLSRGLLKCPRFEVRSGGFDTLEAGIEDVRKGRARGHKLVYLLGEDDILASNG